MGLWQHVWLEATGPVAVRDPAAMTDVRLPAPTEAAVTVRCQFDNPSPEEKSVELYGADCPRWFRRRAGRIPGQGNRGAAKP